LVHADAPAAENLPAAQAGQKAAEISAWKVPAPQLVHALADHVEYVAAAHPAQAAAPVLLA
jgi:hypothetical protein